MMHSVLPQWITHILFFQPVLPHSRTLLTVICQTFLVNQVLQQLLCGFEVIPAPVVWGALRNLLPLHIFWEKWVHQAIFYAHTLFRVEGQHLGEKVWELGGDLGKEILPFLARTLREGLNIFDRIFIADIFHVFCRRCSKDRYHPLNLVKKIFSRK